MECFSSKLEDCLQSRHDQGVYSHSTSRLSVRLSSSPRRWVPSALMVVKGNDGGEPLTPNSSTRRCKQRDVSEPSSRKA